MGRPIITSNTPGCKEVVDNGINGYLCLPRDFSDLALKMINFITLPYEQKVVMGRNSRNKAEALYDEKIIISRYIDCIQKITLNK